VPPPPVLPPVQAYHPATFQERGVAVPFTTPLLAGARVRRGVRYNVEMVVPNPSGGRGVYILPWNSVRTLCRPTVHDSRLNQRIAGLSILTPASVRRMTQGVASQGLAGRQAMEAADAAAAMDRKDQLQTSFMLLVALTEQAEPGKRKAADWQRERSLELERHARQSIVRIAPTLGRTPDDVLTALAELTEVFHPVGVAEQSVAGRVPRLLGCLVELRDELADWMRDHCEDNHIELADMIAAATGQAITATETALNAAQAMTQDVTGLLLSWGKTPGTIVELAARPEWLLDGWERVCLLWRCSVNPEQRRAAMTEMAQLVPVMPRETTDWTSLPVDTDDSAWSQNIVLNKDWRTGAAVLNLIARNERLRAFAV
jgi:hypothetical protein